MKKKFLLGLALTALFVSGCQKKIIMLMAIAWCVSKMKVKRPTIPSFGFIPDTTGKTVREM